MANAVKVLLFTLVAYYTCNGLVVQDLQKSGSTHLTTLHKNRHPQVRSTVKSKTINPPSNQRHTRSPQEPQQLHKGDNHIIRTPTSVYANNHPHLLPAHVHHDSSDLGHNHKDDAKLEHRASTSNNHPHILLADVHRDSSDLSYSKRHARSPQEDESLWYNQEGDTNVELGENPQDFSYDEEDQNRRFARNIPSSIKRNDNPSNQNTGTVPASRIVRNPREEELSTIEDYKPPTATPDIQDDDDEVDDSKESLF